MYVLFACDSQAGLLVEAGGPISIAFGCLRADWGAAASAVLEPASGAP